MDDRTESLPPRLLQALAESAAQRAGRLLQEAVARAEAEVLATLTSAARAALLQQAVAALQRSGEDSVRGAEATDPERQACYLYGVVAADHRGLPRETPAVHPASPVRLLREAELQALLSLVPLDEFPPAGDGAPVQDLEWVAARAAAHDDVLAAALEHGPVIPLRFGTITRTAEAARAFLARHQKTLVTLLASLRGKREWGVKVERRADVGVADPEPIAPAARAGTAYLRRRQREHARREEARRHEQAFLRECHERLGALAAGAALLPVRAAGAGSAPLVFNGAYLVDDAGLASFRALVESLAAAHGDAYAFRLSGPWPAYNFVHLDLNPRETP